MSSFDLESTKKFWEEYGDMFFEELCEAIEHGVGSYKNIHITDVENIDRLNVQGYGFFRENEDSEKIYFSFVDGNFNGTQILGYGKSHSWEKNEGENNE